ncbi:TPA: hypothetical protein QIT10_003565 [Enterobacter bugandensis]|nr:hypothetical protein [Enterobacter bugandensis]HEP0376136.1 hypothetical protein [Enterobacter bugandensis]
MATQPTQDAVPSESPRDLKFNAGKIDEFVTSMGWTYTDRFGVQHYTIEGMRWLAQQAIAAFGYITLDSFEDGNTLTLPNQVLRLEATGEYYRWDGAFPKDVPAGSTPDSAGGVGVGKWLSVGDATLRSDLAESDGLKLTGQKVNYGIPSGSSLTRGLIWAFDKIKGWLRVGGSDLEPLDDEKNYWRGLPSNNSWGDPANIGDYSISFGRNGASFAVYTVTLGHDCVTYGVASLAGGAGSATGNPDDITSPNGEGYCSFAYGKNVIALGSKSAAFCEEVEANSRASFAAGYFTQAREGLTSDPGGVASDGIGATALGYSTRAAGDGSFAAGRDIQAYGGSVAIGSGINPGNPASNPNAKSVALYSNSVVPGVTVAPAGGGVSDLPFVGIHTSYPKEPLDIVMPNGTNAAFRIGETGTARIKLQGTSNSGASLDIASLEWASTNGGSAVGTLKINMNNGAQSIELSADGMVALKNVKTLDEISGAPAGTIYKDASNFLKIVV